jgi:hypothetical protein
VEGSDDGRPLTATRGGAASVVAREGGGAHEVCSTSGLLEEVRGGQGDHQSRRIDDEPLRWHCSPWSRKAEVCAVYGISTGKVCTRGQSGLVRSHFVRRPG